MTSQKPDHQQREQTVAQARRDAVRNRGEALLTISAVVYLPVYVVIAITGINYGAGYWMRMGAGFAIIILPLSLTSLVCSYWGMLSYPDRKGLWLACVTAGPIIPLITTVISIYALFR